LAGASEDEISPDPETICKGEDIREEQFYSFQVNYSTAIIIHRCQSQQESFFLLSFFANVATEA